MVLFLEGFKKENQPTFNGEIKKSEEVVSWLLGLRKYFEVYNYSENMKEWVAISNMRGKDGIWLEDLKSVKGIRESLTWSKF